MREADGYIDRALSSDRVRSKEGWRYLWNGTWYARGRVPTLAITDYVPQVLRYSQYTRAITDVIRSGQLGQLINAQHIEPIGHWHFAHSYVRGNWSKEAESSFSLMTKSCQCVLSSDEPRAGECRTTNFCQRH